MLAENSFQSRNDYSEFYPFNSVFSGDDTLHDLLAFEALLESFPKALIS